MLRPKHQTIEIGKITLHHLFASHDAQIARIGFLLKSYELLSAEACRHLLCQHPILVVVEKGEPYCVGGLRTFQIASRILPCNEKILVNFIDSDEYKVLEEIVYTDLFLSSLCFSTVTPKHVVHEMASWLPKNCLKRLSPVMAKTKAAFSNALNLSKIHPKKRSPEE